MFYKTHRSPLAKLRQHKPGQAPPTMSNSSSGWDAPEYADLFSRDKVKLKAAVKKYVSSRVRDDWTFTWSPEGRSEPTTRAADATAPALPERLEQRDPVNIQDETQEDDGYQVDTDPDDAINSDLDMDHDSDDARSVYSIVSDDPTHYKPRIEWDSDYPVDEDALPPIARANTAGLDDEETKARRRAQQRRDLRKEMEWNPGLACFEARRNAWTEARVVQLRPKPETPTTSSSPTSQRSSRRRFFRRSVSSTSSAGTTNQPGASSSARGERSPQRESENDTSKTDKTSNSDSLGHGSYPVETIVPVAAPILPPQCLLRAGIQPDNYLKLYDKCILDNQQPACPVNLADTINALVMGWKRDGEWPPRPAIPNDFPQRASTGPTEAAGERRKSLTGLLSRDRTAEARAGKGVRQSLSRALGLGTHIEAPGGPRPTMAG
ncbi:uncharacterized protein F5Z01DRAFT_634290 [Emericellopsis atlantica]|uniref:Gag1-like clamp domain-containing protein n=1 Tax=Emericellopsis atlantica TaxID=2614577 RepID=A0A9P7ZS68_9HYPO|nr:uncharacterized protein F5Z01DRAFT_634290 [Emericellopsis atlantica]KAG9256715.1 hypothetical protein F5Z01DRAFT_634290 [Emericellopsis atlantica]